MKKKCTQCGSEDLLENLRVADRGENNYKHEIEIEMDTRPGALLRKGTASAKVKASMCCVCGNIMLSAPPSFATNLKQFKETAGRIGDPTEHPLYKQFIKSDPANKYLEAADQVNGFADWLSKHGPDSQ